MKKLITLFAVLFATSFTYGQTKPIDTDGDGYYNISTLDHLRWISENDSSWTWNFELDNDIDASDTRNWNFGSGWNPIGNGSVKYCGNFDGNGHIIADLYMNRPNESHVAFIGLTCRSEIKNIGLVDCDITGSNLVGALVGYNWNFSKIENSYSEGIVSGGRDVGGLVGRNSSALISNSHSEVTVTYSGHVSHKGINMGGLVGNNTKDIIDCYAAGSVTGKENIGGITGGSSGGGRIIRSYSTGNMSGENAVGGLAGKLVAKTEIRESFATGDVTGTGDGIGGLVGLTEPVQYSYYATYKITDSYSTGNVSGVNEVGGLIGNAAGNNTETVSRCYSTGDVTGTGSDIGGFIGKNGANPLQGYWKENSTLDDTGNQGDIAEVFESTNAELKNQATFVDWDFTNIWGIYASINSSYPILKKLYKGTLPEAPTDTDGDGYYNISTLSHLRWISENDSSWTWNFELDNDIDASDTKNWNVGDHDNDASTPDSAMGWNPIGSDFSNQFEGDFMGHDYTINNLYCNRPRTNNVGLFGYSASGTISNVSVTDCNIKGASAVGGLCGYSNSHISNSSSSGSVTGVLHVGGLCGYVYLGVLSGSYSTCLVKGDISVGGLYGFHYKGMIQNSYATGDVTGDTEVGGLCGFNSEAIIQNSYATGEVTGDTKVGGLCGHNLRKTIQDSYATGEVTGDTEVGGLCGFNNSGSISNSYSIGQVSGNSDTGGFLGIDYQSNGNFTGNFWDTQTSGQIISATGTGKNTAEMKTQSTFTNWDFINIWGISPSKNNGYPYFRETVIHNISLKSGWNFISSYLLPADSNIVNIFADIQNDFLLARGENSTIYFPNLQLNSIGNWNFKKGYNVYMTKDITLSITGVPAPSNSTIDLKQGWNMVSFLMSEETDITTALAGIANDLLIVKDGAGHIYFPNLNINNIGTMKPGEGYYIYMKNAATLDYP